MWLTKIPTVVENSGVKSTILRRRTIFFATIVGYLLDKKEISQTMRKQKIVIEVGDYKQEILEIECVGKFESWRLNELAQK